MTVATIQRNALAPAYESTRQVAAQLANDHSPSADAAIFLAELLEIYSRRPTLDAIPQGEVHALFQEAGPALAEAEHLFNQGLASVRLGGRGAVQHA